MYRKKRGWSQHLDFMAWDILTLEIALFLAFVFMAAMVLMDIFFALIDPKIRARYK